MNRSGKTSSIGEWTTPSGKIGLMYASDYMLSLGVNSLSYTSSSNKSTLKTSWLYLKNNDTTGSSEELTLARSGKAYNRFYTWYVDSSGALNSFSYSTGGVRPSFYLNSNITASGSGTVSDPYIITN